MMMSIQPAFSFNLAKMRYLDNALYSSSTGRRGLTEAEAAIVASDLRAVQDQLDRAQRAISDMFQTYRNAKTKPY